MQVSLFKRVRPRDDETTTCKGSVKELENQNMYTNLGLHHNVPI